MAKIKLIFFIIQLHALVILSPPTLGFLCLSRLLQGWNASIPKHYYSTICIYSNIPIFHGDETYRNNISDPDVAQHATWGHVGHGRLVPLVVNH